MISTSARRGSCWTVTTTSLISVRSSSLRSRSVVVVAAHRRGQVAREPGERFTLGCASAARAGALELGELAPLALELGERLSRARASRVRATSRFSGSHASNWRSRAVGFELGALDREPLTGEPLVVLGARARRSPRCTRAIPAGVIASRNAAATAFSSRAPPSDWQALSVPCRWCARTHA